MRAKCFPEGVSAEPWTTDEKFWSVVVRRREGSVSFHGLDELKRRGLSLRRQVLEGRKPFLLSGDVSEDGLSLRDRDDASALLVAIGEAVTYLATSSDESWREVPADVFTAVTSAHEGEPVA